MQNKKFGTLYVVATPIGNLQDMSLRAIETLKSVDKIAAEDTRHSMLLLDHYSIKKPTLSLHEHNERDRINSIIHTLQAGESVALISDAGTPLINDPGYHIVRAAREAGMSVVPIPGACAAIAAISAAGLPTSRFTFEGFLPAKQEACRKRLSLLANETRTMIFYETPHRLMMALEVMAEIFGIERQCVVARELTKIHETILSDSLANMIKHFQTATKQIRGEFVICVAGVDEDAVVSEVFPEKVLDILLEELPLKQAAALASKITGERKNVLYELALKKQGSKQ